MAVFETRLNKMVNEDVARYGEVVKKYTTESKVLTVSGVEVQPSVYSLFYNMFQTNHAEELTSGTDITSIIPAGRNLIEEVLAVKVGAQLDKAITDKVKEIDKAIEETCKANENSDVFTVYKGDEYSAMFENNRTYEECSLFQALAIKLYAEDNELTLEEKLEHVDEVAECGLDEEETEVTVNALATDTIIKLMYEEVTNQNESCFPVEDVTQALTTVLETSKRLLTIAVEHDFDVSGFEASTDEEQAMKKFRTKLLASVPRSCIVKTTRKSLEVSDIVDIICKLIGSDLQKLDSKKIGVACRKAWLKANGINVKLTTAK